MKPRTIQNIIYYSMIVLVLIGVFYMVYYTKQEGFKCQSSPFTYAVRTLTSSDKQDIICSCSFPSSTQILLFNKDNVTLKNYFNLTLNMSG